VVVHICNANIWEAEMNRIVNLRPPWAPLFSKINNNNKMRRRREKRRKKQNKKT
jgi:hypothetical protein